MTREEFAIAIGCTPEAATKAWVKSNQCDCGKGIVDNVRYGVPRYECDVCGRGYAEMPVRHVCALPDPFDADVDPKELDDWPTHIIPLRSDVRIACWTIRTLQNEYKGELEWGCWIRGGGKAYGKSAGQALINACIASLEMLEVSPLE